MAVYYTFKQADIDKCAAQGVTLTIAGTPVINGTTVSEGQTVRATSTTGNFKLNTAGTITPSFNFSANTNNYFFRPVSGQPGTIVDAAITTVSQYDTNTAFNVGASITEGIAGAMTWGNKPTTVNVGVETTFTWSGGTAPYSVIVLRPDGVSEHDNVTGLATGSYAFRVESGEPTGNYTVNIKDSAGTPATLTSTIAVSEAPLPAVVYTFTASDITMIGAGVLKIGGNTVVAGSVARVGDVATLTPPDGSKITSARMNKTGSPSYVTFNINVDGSQATYTYVVLASSATYTGIVSVYAKLPNQYTFTTADIDALTTAHVDLVKGSSPVVAGTKVITGDSLTATAQSGYELTLISDPLLPSRQIASVYFTETSSAGNKNTPFALSGDKKSATFTMVNNTGSFIYGRFNVTSVQVTPDVTGTNNIYKVDKDILAAVNLKRFKVVSDGGTTPNETVYDYGQFILSVLKLPFAIPTQYILNDEHVLLANLDTQVNAPALSSDSIKIDMGSITVPTVDNNLLDYINTVAVLRLPRADSINIDLEYVIGKTINIEYLLDCYTGRATINIISSETGETIATKQADLGVSVPYINIHNDAQLSNSNVEVGGDNGIYTPFIELIKIETLLKDGQFTIPVTDETVLSSASGYIEVDKVDLISRALGNEKSAIISALMNGVIIK